MIYRYDIILINYVLRKDEESEIMQTLRIEHLTKTYGEKRCLRMLISSSTNMIASV